MLKDRVIRTACVISFVGHCLFLGLPGFNPGLAQSKMPEEIIVKIEIERLPLLPKIDVMGEEKKIKEMLEEPEPLEPEPEEQMDEIIIEEPKPEPPKELIEVINPQQEVMLRYHDMVKQRIESFCRYPNWAKRQGFEGVVYLTFIVTSSGLARDIKIVHSSGFNILDQEAVSTVKRANPFPPVPKQIRTSFVQM